MFYLMMHSTHFNYGVGQRKAMFYLMMHSTHFIYGVGHVLKEGRKCFI